MGDVGVEVDAAGVGAVIAQARQGKSVHGMPEAAKPGGNRLAGPSATPAAGNQNESCHCALLPFLGLLLTLSDCGFGLRLVAPDGRADVVAGGASGAGREGSAALDVAPDAFAERGSSRMRPLSPPGGAAGHR
jgi:hypothetical protein